MAEKWNTQDSARTMVKKYNDTVDELNESIRWIERQQSDFTTERTSVDIDTLSNDAVDRVLNGEV